MRKLWILPLIALGFFFSQPAQALEKVQEVVSNGGIKAWLIQDNTNPIVAIRIGFRGGAALDPVGKEGLARLASSTMDEGAGPWDSQAFQSRLEDLSITLRFEAGLDDFTGNILTLKENLPVAMEMLGAALTEPRFDAGPVERIRNQILSSIRQNATDPNTVAGQTLFKTIFKDHPYSRGSKGTEAGVAAITQADLKQFVATRLAKDNLIIGVAGDITPAELRQLLDQTFGALPEKAAPWKVAEVDGTFTGKTIVVDKAIPQSSILFAQKGIDRNDPDFYDAYVLNYILGGGGFASRLYAEVREKRGLVYSVYSYLANFRHSDAWIAGAGTQNARVTETLDVVKNEWMKAAEQGVSVEEVTNAKTYLTGSFALRFRSSDAIASILLGMQQDNLPIDFLETRNSQIEAVTHEKVNAIAKKLLKPENLQVVIVGQPEGVASH